MKDFDSIAFKVSSIVMDTVNFSSSSTDSSIEISLEPPFASYDSISIDFLYLEDLSNLTTVDIAYTYRTPILGDYDLDDQLTYNDMWNLVENWEAKNYNYELGPTAGDIPHLITYPDSKFDINDGMAFVQTWSWYQNTFGEIFEDTSTSGSIMNIFQSDGYIYIPLSDSILCGQIQILHKNESNSPNIELSKHQENDLHLTSYFPERGYSIMEFARSGMLSHDTIQVNISSLDEGKLFYTLKNKNALQKGNYEINHEPMPETLMLYPAFPNPFNPVTTIRFDIPLSTNGSQKASLIVYDVKEE